jgi:hypothetical protein
MWPVIPANVRIVAIIVICNINENLCTVCVGVFMTYPLYANVTVMIKMAVKRKSTQILRQSHVTSYPEKIRTLKQKLRINQC